MVGKRGLTLAGRLGPALLAAAVLVPAFAVSSSVHPADALPSVGGPTAAVPAPVAYPTQEELRLGPPDLSGPDAVRVLATVPAPLTGRPLRDTAFTARQGGREVNVTAERVADGDVQLVLAIDSTVEPQALAREQAAAADLLRALPPKLPTLVLPGGTLTTARAALAEVGALTPRPAGLLQGLPDAPRGHRWLVLITGCPALERLPAAPAEGNLQVSVLAGADECAQRAQALAARGGGIARAGLDLPELIAAVDRVSEHLLGQYRLRIAAERSAGPVEISVAANSLVVQARLPLPATAPGSGSGTSSPSAGASGTRGPGIGAPAPGGAASPAAEAAQSQPTELPRGPVMLALVLVALGVGLLVLLATMHEPAAEGSPDSPVPRG